MLLEEDVVMQNSVSCCTASFYTPRPSLPVIPMQRNRRKQWNGKKNRDLFKKIRDRKGTFYAKMGKIKDRNTMNLTEAEDIKERWQEDKNYTKKLFMTQITTMV